jgi:hypothetical protein
MAHVREVGGAIEAHGVDLVRREHFFEGRHDLHHLVKTLGRCDEWSGHGDICNVRCHLIGARAYY